MERDRELEPQDSEPDNDLYEIENRLAVQAENRIANWENEKSWKEEEC